MKGEKTEESGAGPAVIYCSPCRPGPAADFQDRRYGRGRRLHNRTRQSAAAAQRRWRCTVCAAERA